MMNHPDAPINFALVEFVTRANILNIYTALEKQRMLFELVKYGEQGHQARAFAYMPVPRVKLLVHRVLTGEAMTAGWKFEVFGGTTKGQIESRAFKLEFDPGTRERSFAANPFRMSISNGPGKLTETGGVQPDGKPTAAVQMRLTIDDLTIHMLELRDHLLIHQRDIEAQRYTEQIERYEARQR